MFFPNLFNPSTDLNSYNTLANSLTDSTTGCGIGATVMFVSDCALMIKVVPYSDQPECRLVTERIV